MENGNKNSSFNEWLLGCSKEHKIMLVKKAIEENNVGVYFALTKIFLDTPISQGGIASHEIPSPADENLHVDYHTSEFKYGKE